MTDGGAAVLRYYELFNAGELDRLADLLDEEAELSLDTQTIRGREPVRRFLAGVRQNLADLTAVPQIIAVTGDTFVTEVGFTRPGAAAGQDEGAWRLAGTTCEIVRVRDGRIVGLRSYFNPDPDERAPASPVPDRDASADEEQAALRQVATRVAEGASEEEVLATVNEQVARIVGADSTTLLRFEDDDTVTLVAAWSPREPSLPVGDRRPVVDALRTVRAAGRPIRLDVLPDGVPFLEDARARSAVGVPITVDRSVWGVVFAGGGSDGPLPERTEERIGRFTQLAATALANAQARARLQQLADEQAALRRVAELVAQGGGQDELFASVAEEASKLVGDEPTTLLRFDVDGHATVVATCRGPAPVGARFPVSPDDESTPARILRTGRPARSDSYASVDSPSYARKYGVGSSVGAPIVVEDRVWGMLGATTPDRRFPREAELRLHQFTELVAAALANVQARADVQMLADEQAALRRVAELVAREVEPDELLSAVVTEASRLLGDAATGLSRYEPAGDALLVAACRNPAPVGLRISCEGRTCHGEVLRTGRPFRVTSYEGTPLQETAGELGVKAAVGVPVIVEGRVWGMLSASVPGQTPPAGAEGRLAHFAGLVGTAVANAASRAQLAASRARVVAAADESRRRLQRDVHDGAQQRLIQAVITLKVAKEALRGDDSSFAELIDESLYHAERATAELRDLVRGILPASLSRGGLRAAVDSLAADVPLPVEVDVTDARFAPEAETTAYFVIAEALTNVVKHARATHAAVRAQVEDDVLVIEVRDDGVGGADAAGGSGLTGLSDRVAACEGSVEIHSEPRGGTALRARLPLSG